jgi:hypothetical protein
MDSRLSAAKSEIERKLQVFNDRKFTFEEGPHIYKYDGKKFDSVTTFLKTFKVPFDREYWSKRKAEERGVDQSVILEEWNTKSVKSMDIGTSVHKYIEDFWSQRNPEIPDEVEVKERVEKFIDFYNKKLHVFHPLKSELRVFSKRWRLSGTIDQPLLFWDDKLDKPFLVIGDWKTNGEFKDDYHPKGRYKKLLRPFSHLYENNHNEYSIQISLYRLILEEEANIETQSGFLCHIGPDGPPKLYPAKDLREPLRAYLEDNRVEFDIFDIA